VARFFFGRRGLVCSGYFVARDKISSEPRLPLEQARASMTNRLLNREKSRSGKVGGFENQLRSETQHVSVRPLFHGSCGPISSMKGALTMADIISDLAAKSGVSPDLAKKGMGALLSFMKEKVPGDSFAKVTGAIPGADSMMAAAAEKGQEASGGVMSAVTGLAGKLFGGAGGAPELLSKLTQFGFSADQLQRFIPTVLGFLKTKLPSDVMNKITAAIPIGATQAD
jgi:hypothetical protein